MNKDENRQTLRTIVSKIIWFLMFIATIVLFVGGLILLGHDESKRIGEKMFTSSFLFLWPLFFLSFSAFAPEGAKYETKKSYYIQKRKEQIIQKQQASANIDIGNDDSSIKKIKMPKSILIVRIIWAIWTIAPPLGLLLDLKFWADTAPGEMLVTVFASLCVIDVISLLVFLPRVFKHKINTYNR
jgi:hypothetical protein